MIGVLLGLSGAGLLIFLDNPGSTSSGSALFGILVVIACFMYALSSNVVKQYFSHLNSLTISAVSFSMIGPIGLILLLSTDFVGTMQAEPAAWTSLGAILLLALAGTVFASVIFFYLVQVRDALYASMVSYLVPLVALFWGLLDGESVRWVHLLGMTFILLGLYISRKRQRSKA